MTKYLSILLGVLILAGFVYLAFVDIPLNQQIVTETIPADQYLDAQ